MAGFYPIGGIYSSKAGTVQTSGNKGALGAGIIPIILSSYVQFILSEAILTGNVSGDARSKFISGINQSIDKTLTKINNYPLINDSDEPYPSNPEGVLSPGTYTNSSGNSVVLTLTSNRDNYSTYGYINIRDRQAYLNFMTNEFDNASSPKKLEIVMKEYFIASWGNGIEPYNNYRRTGYPSNFQPTIEPVSGDYFYKALYPASAINNNGNVPTAGRTKRVFWDKANLILH